MSISLPGRDTIMFVLDKDQNFKLIDAEDFKTDLCKMLGVKQHKLILHRFERGSIVLSILVPGSITQALRITPLYHNSMLSLKNWNTLSVNFSESDIINLSRWHVLNAVDLTTSEGTISDTECTRIVPVQLEEEEFMALEYRGTLAGMDTADAGYVDYLESLFSGKHKNIPQVKGIYYQQPEQGQCVKNKYPMVIIEKLKPLKDLSSEREIPEVSQVSILLNIVNSLEGFKSSTSHKVSVCAESVFVSESLSETEAKFCPLYGSSFSREANVHVKVSTAPLPLADLEWMNDLIKFMQFQGSVTDENELPDKHILKKMFGQKWLAKDPRFRPSNFKTLSEELRHLLGQ